MNDVEYRNTDVMVQARGMYKAWLKRADPDDLLIDDVEDLVIEMYPTEHRRDGKLCEALRDLIFLKKADHAPRDTHAVALATLRYEDAI